MHLPELITKWRKCFGCGEWVPLPQQPSLDGAEVRFCLYCGQLLAGVYAHG